MELRLPDVIAIRLSTFALRGRRHTGSSAPFPFSSQVLRAHPSCLCDGAVSSDFSNEEGNGIKSRNANLTVPLLH